MTPTTWILIAFGAALVAMAITGLGRGGGGAGTFLRDVWPWARREPGPIGTAALTDAHREPAADDGGVDDLFTLGSQPLHGYMEPADLSQPFARFTMRAVGGLRGRVHRAGRPAAAARS